MNIDLNDAIVRLNPDNNFQMRDARGACVHVHWGDLWITQEGDLRDHVVTTGESFAISNSGITYLTAMSEAGVSVMEKCKDSELVSAAAISTAALTAASDAADTSTWKFDDHADESSLAGAQRTNLLPSADEIGQHIARADRVRARFFAGAATRIWSALGRPLGMLRELG